MDKLSRFDAENVMVNIPKPVTEKMEFVLDWDDEDEEDLPERDDDDEDEEESPYSSSFSLDLSGVYFDAKDESMKINYDLLLEEIDPVTNAKSIEPPEMPKQETQPGNKAKDTLFKIDMIYPDAGMHSRSMGNTEMQNETYLAEVLSIKYDSADVINGQKTYQRIVFEADVDGESIYELSMRKMKEAGIDMNWQYDNEFDSMMFTSINGMKEGTEGNFNEFYQNGEIGRDAIDRQNVNKGDIIEWRYAEETDGSCGGVPDFERVKNLLYQYGETAMLLGPNLPAQPRQYQSPFQQNQYNAMAF